MNLREQTFSIKILLLLIVSTFVFTAHASHAAEGDIWLEPVITTANADEDVDMELHIDTGAVTMNSFRAIIDFTGTDIIVDTSRGSGGSTAGADGGSFSKVINATIPNMVLVSGGEGTIGATGNDLHMVTIHMKTTPSFSTSTNLTFQGGSIILGNISGGFITPNPLSGMTITNSGGDATPPARSNGAPSGTLPSGTTTDTLSLDTHETATCKYDTNSGTAYAAMANTFSTTNATSHSDPLTGLTDGTAYTYYVRCEDTSTNANPDDYVISFSVDTDTTAPVLAEITPVASPTNDATPDYTFSTDENGTISIGGSCASADTAAVVGNNTITFNTLATGTYSDCTITVTDAASNPSTPLAVTSFTIDVTAPTLAEVTPISTPTTDTTPDYVFSSDEIGTIAYSGSCASGTTAAANGNNTITLNSLSDGTYTDCDITVTDAVGNTSSILEINDFTIDTIAPSVMITAPTKADTAAITDTTIRITDATSVLVADVTIDGATTAPTSAFNCTQTSTTQVDCTISIDDSGDLTIAAVDGLAHSATASENGYIIDSVAPTVTITAPTTVAGGPITDTTIQVTDNQAVSVANVTIDGATTTTTSAFNCTQTSTMQVDCTITINASGDLTITADDDAGNNDTDTVTGYSITDMTAPIIAEVTPVVSPTNDDTPEYTFSSDEAGTISYGGSCSSADTAAVVGNNTITFSTLADGVYSDCTITVTDASSNVSIMLAVSNFIVDTIAPAVTITAPTKSATAAITDTTIQVIDNSAITAANVTVDSATTAPTSAFNCTQTSTTQVDCTISIDDSGDLTILASDNANNSNTVSETGYTLSVPPIRSNGRPYGIIPDGSTTAILKLDTNENATCKYATTAGTDYASMSETFTTTGTQSHSTEVSSLVDGSSYKYYVRCEDTALNVNIDDFIITFTVDTEDVDPVDPIDPDKPPVDPEAGDDIKIDVKFDGKKSNFSLSTREKAYIKEKSVTFRGKAPNIVGGKVVINVKGEDDEETEIEKDGSWSEKVKFDKSKTYTVKLKFYDKKGNQVESVTYKIRIDTKKPEFTDLPDQLTKRHGDKVWWEATDDKGVKKYKYYLNGQKVEVGKNNYFHVSNDLPRGTYELQVRAYDKARNKETKTVQLTVI